MKHWMPGVRYHCYQCWFTHWFCYMKRDAVPSLVHNNSFRSLITTVLHTNKTEHVFKTNAIRVVMKLIAKPPRQVQGNFNDKERGQYCIVAFKN